MITQKILLAKMDEEDREDDKKHHGGYGAALAFLRRRMPNEEKQEIYRRYPWIIDSFNGNLLVHSAYVSPISLELASLCPVEKEKMYLLDERGQIFFYEAEALFGRLLFWKDQPVMERVIHIPEWMSVEKTLQRLGEDAERVRFVISYCKPTCALIIYEPPDKLKLKEWFRMLRGKRGAELAAANNVIEKIVRADV